MPIKIWFAEPLRPTPKSQEGLDLKRTAPSQTWQSKYDWSYCYGALDPVEGKTVFVQTPSESGVDALFGAN